MDVAPYYGKELSMDFLWCEQVEQFKSYEIKGGEGVTGEMSDVWTINIWENNVQLQDKAFLEIEASDVGFFSNGLMD